MAIIDYNLSKAKDWSMHFGGGDSFIETVEWKKKEILLYTPFFWI